MEYVVSEINKQVYTPGTHDSECLCSDCKGARMAREAAEQRARREAALDFAADKSPWAGDGWRN